MEEVRNVIFKLANSFDSKEWVELEKLLANPVVCDYTSLRGVIETLTPGEYVQKRIKALDHLLTQHFISNLEVYVQNNKAKCRAISMILRNKNGIIFNTHAIYHYELSLTNDKWLINFIKQDVLWNEGDPSLHSGAKGAQNG